MIELFTSPTPNGHKVSIALEEMGLDYEFHTIDLRSGEQKREPFLTHSPNGRIPAIYDRDFDLSIFESGAMLLDMYTFGMCSIFFPGFCLHHCARS